MPNARVTAAGGAMPAELPTFEEMAALVLRKSAQRLDAMRKAVERDLKKHDRSRAKVEALIETLIAGLDTLDGDGDRESDFDHGRPIDPDCEFDVGDAPHDDERFWGPDFEPSLGATEGVDNQKSWSFGGRDDREFDPADDGIGDSDALSLIRADIGEANEIRRHARFDGSGERLAREHLAHRGRPVRIAPRVREGGAVRVGNAYLPR